MLIDEGSLAHARTHTHTTCSLKPSCQVNSARLLLARAGLSLARTHTNNKELDDQEQPLTIVSRSHSLTHSLIQSDSIIVI